MRDERRQTIEVRRLEPRDFPVVRALQLRVVPGFAPWSARQMQAQLKAFPEGQLVALRNGEVAGLCSCLMVKWDDWLMRHTFEGVTAGGSFSTHNPEGRTLYGAMTLIDPDSYVTRTANALHLARRRLCAALGLRRVIAPSRMPGYSAVQRALEPEQYAMRVAWGDLHDAELSGHIARGFVYCGVIRNYIAQDEASCGNAAIVAWTNRQYRVVPVRYGRPPRRLEPEVVAPSPPAMAA